jgi:tRNA modification GTPase
MIEKLLSTASTGRMIREGIRVAIVGKPNVGKSSLMNGLLKETRAIVTEIPGTTRDTIEETVSIRNIPVYLVDTAGIRETSDKVEKIGIEKSKEAFNNADFIIFILDGSTELSEEDKEIIEYMKERKSLVLVNKNDLEQKLDIEMIKNELPESQVIRTSLINGEGIEEIENSIEELVYGGEIVQKESMMVNNVRHIELLKQGRDSLNDAFMMAQNREALDFLEIDVKNAYDFLGEIIGETVSDDIINEVFARFCLGK